MKTKYDALRESGKRTRLTYRSEEPRDPAQHELWRLENMIEDGSIIEVGEFTPFELYLLDKLLHSSEDCCMICAQNPGLGICDAILPDGSMRETVCRRGVRSFFEAQKRARANENE